MGTRWPETCWGTYKGEINIILKVTSSWSLYPHWNEINIDCVGICVWICTLNHSQTATVQQNERQQWNETRPNRHSVVGLKGSVHAKEELLEVCLVMTYILYAAAEKQTVPRQILGSGPRKPIDVFPRAKFITAVCSMSCCSIIERVVSEGVQLDLPARVATLHTNGHFPLSASSHVFFAHSSNLCDSIKNVAPVSPISHWYWKSFLPVMTHRKWY